MVITAFHLTRNVSLILSSFRRSLIHLNSECQLYHRCSILPLNCIWNNSYHHLQCPTANIVHSKTLCFDGLYTNNRKFNINSRTLSNSNMGKPMSEETIPKSIPDQIKTNSNAESTGNEQKLTLWQKFKKLYKEYWYVLVPVHLVTSIVWYGSFYYVAKSGVDIASILKEFGAGEMITSSLENTGAGYFALAYAMYKLATPARYTVTLAGTTVTINYLQKWGILKSMPSGQEIKNIVQDKLRFHRRQKLKTKRKNDTKLKDDKLKHHKP